MLYRLTEVFLSASVTLQVEDELLAAVYRRRGSAHEVLRVEELPDPHPGPGEVRVRVHASGVNPTDWKSRTGDAPLAVEYQIPNQDGAGVIDEVGEGVDASRIGERVWLFHAAWNRVNGTAAQYTVIPSEQAVLLPESVDFNQGAGLAIPYITAHGCLYLDGPITGRTILIAGGAGAVGHAAIELAKFDGAHVITTVSSPEKAEIARAAGADVVVNYRDVDVVDQIKAASGGVDRVIEVALGANLDLDLAVLRPAGSIITYATEPTGDPQLPVRRLMTDNVTLRFVLVYNFTNDQITAAVDGVSRALDAGALTPLPETHFSLEQIADAHAAVEAGITGKVIVDIP